MSWYQSVHQKAHLDIDCGILLGSSSLAPGLCQGVLLCDGSGLPAESSCLAALCLIQSRLCTGVKSHHVLILAAQTNASQRALRGKKLSQLNALNPHTFWGPFLPRESRPCRNSPACLGGRLSAAVQVELNLEDPTKQHCQFMTATTRMNPATTSFSPCCIVYDSSQPSGKEAHP